MTPVSIILLVLALLWAISQGRLARGLENALEPVASPTDDELPTVSIIIPARNESVNITACLQSILNCTFPPDRTEILVVNDGSTDNTAHLAAGMLEGQEVTGRVLSSPPNEESGNKQQALQLGILHATGEIILTTDADCRVAPGWIYSMISCFDNKTELVAGPVQFIPTVSLFDKMQSVEFLGLIALGAGSIGLGKGTICNSANLAYRRSTYLREDIKDNHPASDELLLQSLSEKNPNGVRFCHHAQAMVSTAPAASFRTFWRQRVRWASMGVRYPDWTARLLAVGAWSFHALLLAATLGVILGMISPWPVLAAWALKLIGDAALLFPFLSWIDEKRLIRYFLPAELLHPLYVTAVGFWGTFGQFTWKQ